MLHYHHDHYDRNLKLRLPSNNDTSDVVLNRFFSDWNKPIESNIKGPCEDGNEHYERDPELLAAGKAHLATRNSVINQDKVIMLTHPVYLHLTHMDELTDATKKDADKYFEKLMYLFEQKKEDGRIKIIVLDTLYHYAAASSLLLESGLVDKVILTQNDSGKLLNSNDLGRDSNRCVFAGGGYAGKRETRCLDESMKEIRAAYSPKHIWAIADLCIASPQDRKNTLKPRKIRHLKRKRIITLDEALDRIRSNQL